MNCPICGNENNISIILDKVYYKCKNCECIYLDKKYRINTKKEKEIYSKHDNKLNNTGYVSMMNKFIKNAVLPFSKTKKTILEFGCGPGPVLAYLLEKKGFNVYLYDPYFFPFKKNLERKYDIITSTEVFEHLKDPINEIKRLKNLLNNDGILAIMSKQVCNITNFKDWHYRKDETHIVFYSTKTFDYMAKIFNLKKIYDDQWKYCVFKK